jgi:hypothetical protein
MESINAGYMEFINSPHVECTNAAPAECLDAKKVVLCECMIGRSNTIMYDR